MLRILLILTFLLFGPQPDMSLSPDKDFRDVGTARKMSGKTYVLVLFVSEKGQNGWTKADTRPVMDKIHKATNWISKKSKLYGVKNEFKVYSLGSKEQIKLKRIPQGPSQRNGTSDILREAMIAAGYDDGFDFFAYAKEKTSCDNCLVLIVSNTKGKSFATPESRETYTKNVRTGCAPHQLESCLIFSKYNDGRNIAAPTIAHEILHLFGATDLYDSNASRDKQMGQHFPNSIMRRINYTFDKLELDPLTAYLIGLSNTYKDWYRKFVE